MHRFAIAEPATILDRRTEGGAGWGLQPGGVTPEGALCVAGRVGIEGTPTQPSDPRARVLAETEPASKWGGLRAHRGRYGPFSRALHEEVMTAADRMSSIPAHRSTIELLQ